MGKYRPGNRIIDRDKNRINEAAAQAKQAIQAAHVPRVTPPFKRVQPEERSAALDARALIMAHAVPGCGGVGLQHPKAHALITAGALQEAYRHNPEMFAFYARVIDEISKI